MNATTRWTCWLLVVTSCGLLSGCSAWRVAEVRRPGPAYDRPFPLGQVTDSFWETQQTNAEASDFVFYDHEFVGETARLNSAGEKHLLQVAMRLPHVPFPVAVEQSPNDRAPKLDEQRRWTIVDGLTQFGLEMADARVVIAPALAPGISAIEGESAYYRTLDSNDFWLGGRMGRTAGHGGVFW